MQKKVTDLDRFWLSDHICISVEQKQTTEPKSYRPENNGSCAPWRNKPGLVKFLFYILGKKKKKARVGVVLRVAAGALFLLLPCDSPEEQCDLCFHNVNEEIWAKWEDRKGC